MQMKCDVSLFIRILNLACKLYCLKNLSLAGENGEVWRYTDLKMILGNQSTAALT